MEQINLRLRERPLTLPQTLLNPPWRTQLRLKMLNQLLILNLFNRLLMLLKGNHQNEDTDRTCKPVSVQMLYFHGKTFAFMCLHCYASAATFALVAASITLELCCGQ